MSKQMVKRQPLKVRLHTGPECPKCHKRDTIVEQVITEQVPESRCTLVVELKQRYYRCRACRYRFRKDERVTKQPIL